MRGEACFFVKAPAAASEMLDESVNEHVGGAGIESKHLRGLCGGGDYRDVGNATEIEGNAAKLRVAVEKIVGVRDKWGALAGESDVGGTKIADRSDASARSDDAWLADL